METMPSSQDLASASEPRRLGGSKVVASKRTPSERKGPRPHVLKRCILIAEALNPPGIFPPTRREIKPVEYLPRLPPKPLLNEEPSSSRGSSSAFSGADENSC